MFASALYGISFHHFISFLKVTALVEHILFTYEIDEVLYTLRDHIVGLNCGRWDYIFSYIKAFRNHREFLTPNRSEIRMTTPFMQNYARFVIKTCHRRGAHAMGGMAAQIPIKSDANANARALNAVRDVKKMKNSPKFRQFFSNFRIKSVKSVKVTMELGLPIQDSSIWPPKLSTIRWAQSQTKWTG
jgi:hypothetical protein